MKEKTFIIVTNYSKVSAAIDMISGVMTGEEFGVDPQHYSQIMSRLATLQGVIASVLPPIEVGEVKRQSVAASIAEAVVNTGLGFAIAFYAQQILFDFYSIPVTNTVNAWIVVWMTVVSFTRSFVLRRLWNAEFWKEEQR